MFKAYLRLLSVSMALLLVCLAGFNFWADPYERFGRGLSNDQGRLVNYPTMRSWANTTINRVMNGDYDTLFMGNSRTWRGLDPDHVAGTIKAYNASISACNFENMYAVLSAIWSKKQVSRLVIGLDFSMERLGNNLIAKSFSEASAVESLLGFHTLKDSLIMMASKWFYGARSYVLADGQKVKPWRRRTIEEQGEYLNHLLVALNQMRSLPMAQGRGWPYFKDMVRECRHRHINLILFLSPIHVSVMEGIAVHGLYEEFADWVRMIVDIAYAREQGASGGFQVQVWMFCGYNSIIIDPLPNGPGAHEMRWYLEASHYKKDVGDMILDRILGTAGASIPSDFGVRLTPQNVDARLKKMWLDRQAYLHRVARVSGGE